jgi:methionyl-tRNA formyltransferase
MIKKLLNYIKIRLYINETIVLYSLENHQLQSSVATIKHATNDNLKDILYFQHQRYLNVFKNFLSLGDQGYFAYLKDKCIHRSWVKLNEQIVYPHWATPYKLRKNEIFIHYCETAPEARGKNIYPNVLGKIIKEHSNKDILISVNEENIASIKGVEKVGFRERESKSTCDTRDEVYQKNDKRELKVMIITMGLSRIVEPIVNLHNVVGVIECAPRKSKQTNNGILYKTAKKLDSFVKKSRTLKLFAKDEKIPYYYMGNGSDKPLEYWVKNITPDVIVIYSMSQLLKRNIIDIPKYGTINLHPAFLPSYRGPLPDFWMYYNSEKEGGVTVHYIDEGEDMGDIIYQEQYDIPLGMKSPDMLNLAIGKIGKNLLIKALKNIKNLPRQAQVKESPTQRARNIEVEEHTNIIEWNVWEIERIWHMLRGTQLWLNALEQPKGFYKSQRWNINELEKCDTCSYAISQIYKENGRYFVACKDGKIFLSLKFSLKNFVLNIVTNSDK